MLTPLIGYPASLLSAPVKKLVESRTLGPYCTRKMQATFPDNPGIWLKDLASMLNLKLDKVPESMIQYLTENQLVSAPPPGDDFVF